MSNETLVYIVMPVILSVPLVVALFALRASMARNRVLEAKCAELINGIKDILDGK